MWKYNLLVVGVWKKCLPPHIFLEQFLIQLPTNYIYKTGKKRKQKKRIHVYCLPIFEKYVVYASMIRTVCSVVHTSKGGFTELVFISLLEPSLSYNPTKVYKKIVSIIQGKEPPYKQFSAAFKYVRMYFSKYRYLTNRYQGNLC